jgi:hypothetical protein
MCVGTRRSTNARPERFIASARRLVVGSFPDGCRLTEVSATGSIRCDGWKVYLSHALCGYTVGLESVERGYRVWFFHVMFELGIHETLEPATTAVAA